MFGRHGNGSGELYAPAGIAFDPSNKHLYISRLSNPCISVFTCEGQFVASFGENVTECEPYSPAASRHNLASAPIVGFLVEYVYYDHQYEGKVRNFSY